MKHHFVLAAVAAAVLLAGCGASDSDGGAGGQSPRLLAATGRASTAAVSAVNSTDSTFAALSTLHVGQVAYFKVLGSKLPSTLALDVTDCTGGCPFRPV